MKATVIIVTMGDRPKELAHCLDSVARQRGVDLDIILVANGADVAKPATALELITLPENLGPPAARNRGAARATGDILFFLDDDAAFGAPDVVARALDRFAAEPDLGIVTFRIDYPEGDPPQRRHVPRLRARDRHRSSEATTILEGACAIRRDLYERLGGYHEDYVFGHEGTDLAWRAIDAGVRVAYDGSIGIEHPAEPPTRHPFHHERTARNRVLLARRLLPWPLAVLYVSVWFILGLARARSRAAVTDHLAGFRAGFRDDPGERRPISWRAVWRMTRAGRPPIV